MESISTDILVLLIGAAGLAGFIDAIAGGGGLIALPALLWAGIPPLQALATNKLQGSFGTATATFNFARKGYLDWRSLWPAVIMTLTGAVIGTFSVQLLPASLLERIIPLLLVLFSVYFLFSRQAGDANAKQRISIAVFAVSAGFILGFYDGFFGPGTGSFFTAAFVILLGYNLTHAVAGTKLLNFTSNLASLAAFAVGGHVLWSLGLAMGMAQMAGAWLGSHLAIQHGSKIIRPMLVAVSLAVSVKLMLL
jgi:uncharacterized membrane protein YfcA